MRSKISFSPTTAQLRGIKKWLSQEYDDTGEGFYVNWNIIAKSQKEKELVTISVGASTVGFLVFGLREFRATIDMLDIRADCRRSGLGRTLTEAVFENFRSKDVYAVDLQCSPPSSESFWRKLGFDDIQMNQGDLHSNKELFKVLIDRLNPRKPSGSLSQECLELWDAEPYATRDRPPKWIWVPKFRKGTRDLQKPIVHPASRDWRIRWRRGEQVMKDDKVKYFDQNEITHGKFIILKSLPLLPL